MTLLTLSKIKRVCNVALVPRLFRGDGCTPGKFHRLGLDGIQRVNMSSESDDSKNEERRCKKCKRLIEYAFGPPETFDGERDKTPLTHVNIYAKPDYPQDQHHSEPYDNEVPADLPQNAKYKKDITHLEDLKITTLEQAKVDALLRARDVDTVVATIDKKENDINLFENKEDKNYSAKMKDESKSTETETEGEKVNSEVSPIKHNVMLSEGQEAHHSRMHTTVPEKNQLTNAEGLKTEVSYLTKEVPENQFESSEVRKADATFLANAIETLKLETNPSLGGNKDINAKFNSNTGEAKKDESLPASAAMKEKPEIFDSKEQKSCNFMSNPTGEEDLKAKIHIAERNEMESNAENANKMTEISSTDLEKGESILHATATSNENEQNLTQKIEEINELSPVSGSDTKSDILNPPRSIGPCFKNPSPPEMLGMEQMRAQMFDDIAKKHFGSSVNQCLADIKRGYLPKNDKAEAIEHNVNFQGADTTNKPLLLNNQPASEVFTIERNLDSEVVKDASKTLIERDRGTILNEGYTCEALEPVIDSRFHHMCNVQSGQELYTKDDGEEASLLPEHRHPYHLLHTALIDKINPATPTSAVQIREYPSAFMSFPVKRHEPVQYHKQNPTDTFQYPGEGWNYQNQSIAHRYTDTRNRKDYEGTEGWQPQVEPVLPEKPDTMKPILKTEDKSNFQETEVLQPQAGPVIPDMKQDAMKHGFEIEKQDLEQVKNESIDMVQSITQPLPHRQETNKRSLVKDTLNIIDDLPEINLNDDTVPLTELLRRVRERNRIMYCREIGLQMARNLAALNPEGKCGDKKPTCPPPPPPPCPPPPPKCPPPPPACPCPPPPCPKPCPPPPCPPPPPKCPPPKSPCAKFQTQNTVSLALHLGPIINTPHKALVPVIASNTPPPSLENENSNWRNFLLQKLSEVRRIIHSIFEMSGTKVPLNSCLRVFGSKDYTPWTPIPSWPYPIVQRKQKLQCPKEGCPYIPPPSPHRRPPCFEKPCTSFPKRLSFSYML